MRKQVFLFTAGAILLAMIFYSAYLFLYIPRQEEKEILRRQEFVDTLEIHSAGNLELSLQKLREFNEGISEGTSTRENAYIKFFIAINLFRRGAGDDWQEASQILKDIAGDASVAEDIRAFAVSYLVNQYSISQDMEVAKIIFSGNQFAAFLTNNDYDLAVRKGNEFANSIFPTALFEYQIGRWYAEKLREQKLDKELKTNYQKELKAAVDRGVALESASEILPFGRHYVSYIYHIKALDLFSLALAGGISFDEAENAFKKALSIEPETVNVEWFNHALWLNYNYAVFLLQTKRDSKEVEDALRIFSNTPIEYKDYPFSVHKYFKNVLLLDNNDFRRKDLEALIKAIPSFKEHLVIRGILPF